MILGAFWMAVANAASLLGTHALLRRVSTGVGSVDAVLFLLLRLLLISAAVLAAGLSGTLTSTALGLAGAVALAGLLAAGAHREIRAPLLPEVGLASGLLTALVLARLFAQVWFFAPYPGDALSYHLPKIAEWIRAGSFIREMGVDTHVTFPAGFELVETWWAVFLHHDVLIEMAGVEFLVLGSAAVAALARRVGLDPRAAFSAALLYALTPVVYLQATACVNDAPACALTLATAALVAARVPVNLVLLAAGLGIGVKPIYAYALPGIALLALLVRREPVVSRSPSRAAWAAAGVSVLTGCYWYFRNALWFGSATYPVGARGLPGPHPIQFGARPTSLRDNLLALIDERVYDAASAFGPFTSDIAGWGPAAFACGATALAVGLRSDPGLRRLCLALGTSLVSVLLLVMHDPWNLRFVAFFPAVLAIAAARLSAGSRAFGALTALSALMCFAGTCLPRELSLSTFREVVGQPWRERSMARVFGVDVPADTVGYYVDNRNMAYVWYRPDFTRRVVYLRATSSATLAEEINRAAVPYLFASAARLETVAVLEEAVELGLLVKIDRRIYACRRPTP